MPWTPQEAVVAIVSNAMFADGSVTAEEHDELHRTIRDLPGLSRREDVTRTLKTVNERARKDGPDAVLDAAIQATPLEWRRKVYTITKQLTVADGSESEDEADLLVRLRREFGLN